MKTKNKTLLGLIAASFGVAATLVVACTSGERSSAPGGSAPAGSAAPAGTAAPVPGDFGVTDTEIRIGVPSAFDGPSVGLGVEMWRGAEAAFRQANDAGGVHGRKIRLVLASDGYDAERAAAAAVKLVQQDRVFAIGWGVGTPTIVRRLPVILQYFNTEKLFEFGNFTGAQPQRNPPYAPAVFNVRASYYQETKAIVDAFVKAGRRRIGAFVQDDAYGTDGREGTKRALSAHGLDLLADTRYPRGQTYDVSTEPQVRILRAAGVDAVVMVGAYQACGALIRDARMAGWDVPIHNVSFVGPDPMLELLKGTEREKRRPIIRRIINTQIVPFPGDPSVPLVREYQAAMERYNPQVPAEFPAIAYRPANRHSFGSLEGYMNAKAFLQVLDRAGRELTREAFLRAAEGMGRFDLGLGADIVAELSPTRHQALDKVWFTYATAGGWRPTDDIAQAIR